MTAVAEIADLTEYSAVQPTSVKERYLRPDTPET